VNDLTADEQKNVRTALRFLRARCGTWATVSKALRLHEGTLCNVVGGRPVSALVAFRVAKFAKVGVDDVLTGRFPPEGTCPHCGRASSGAPGTLGPASKLLAR
jgi:hypothetical protein